MLFAALCLFVSGCHRELCSGAELSKVKTSAEEARAMELFWKTCRPLSMSAYDKSGAKLSFSDPKWNAKLYRLTLSGGAGAFDHVMIDPKNAYVLMGE
jgi:hypothetical protein